MSHGSVWREEALSIKQVPTLRKLLRCCDERLLVRTVIDEHAIRAAGGSALAPKRRRAIEKRLAATVSTMRRLPLQAKKDAPRFLVPEETFVLQARTGLVERRIAALCVSLDEVAAAGRAFETDGEGASPPVRSYTLAPWEEVLAYRVWLGGPWCTRERYLALASAFWEMTYLGFEYERVCARQAQERARRLLDEGARGCASIGVEPSPSPSDRAFVPREGRARQAIAYGLDEPDRFELDYFDRLAMRVAELNSACKQDVHARLHDLAERLEDV